MLLSTTSTVQYMSENVWLVGAYIFGDAMPQIFSAAACASCSAFQVVQQTKQRKFTCPLCGTKQSLTRSYRTGSARECREAVQALSSAWGAVSDAAAFGDDGGAYCGDATDQYRSQPPERSRWDQYLPAASAQPQRSVDDADGYGGDDGRYTTALPDGRVPLSLANRGAARRSHASERAPAGGRAPAGADCGGGGGGGGAVAELLQSAKRLRDALAEAL